MKMGIFCCLFLGFITKAQAQTSAIPPYLVASAKAHRAYSNEVQSAEKSGLKLSKADEQTLRQKHYSPISAMAVKDTLDAQLKIKQASTYLFNPSKIPSELVQADEKNTAEGSGSLAEQSNSSSTVSAAKSKLSRQPSSNSKTTASRLSSTGSESVQVGGPEAISFSSQPSQ